MKKVLLTILMMFPLFISGCSCDKFDIDTYETAVKNFSNSTGFEYKLTVTTKVEGAASYTRKESINKYLLTTTGEVYDFYSEMKGYKITTSSNGMEGEPKLTDIYNRYYVGDEGKFYTKVRTGNSMDNKRVDSKTYEEMYADLNDENNKNNIVPTFAKDKISNFKISNLEGEKGWSFATFNAPALSFLNSDTELISYEVTMDKNFYFYEIKFTAISGTTTTTYEYSFLNFNSDVNIDFPTDLASY